MTELPACTGLGGGATEDFVSSPGPPRVEAGDESELNAAAHDEVPADAAVLGDRLGLDAATLGEGSGDTAVLDDGLAKRCVNSADAELGDRGPAPR